jgi:hypothetical protein
MIKKLSELNVGDKFWFTDVPYLVIDMDMKNMSLFTDFSNIKMVLCLATYKVIGFDKNITVIQDKDNFPV